MSRDGLLMLEIGGADEDTKRCAIDALLSVGIEVHRAWFVGPSRVDPDIIGNAEGDQRALRRDVRAARAEQHRAGN